jgi:hypothetical protein
MRYRQAFTVRVKFQFPILMLFKEQCFPLTMQDSNLLRDAIRGGEGEWRIRLCRFTALKKSRPDVDFWKNEFDVEILTDSFDIQAI